MHMATPSDQCVLETPHAPAELADSDQIIAQNRAAYEAVLNRATRTAYSREFNQHCNCVDFCGAARASKSNLYDLLEQHFAVQDVTNARAEVESPSDSTERA